MENKNPTWSKVMIDGWPRRSRFDELFHTERVVYDARQYVENNTNAGFYQTKAMTLLGEALEALADHLEGRPAEDMTTETAETAATGVKVGESRSVSDAITAGDTKIAEPVPEKVLFQVFYSTFDKPQAFIRKGEPTPDQAAADASAVEAIAKTYDVAHAFVVRVESAYSRETTVKKVI